MKVLAVNGSPRQRGNTAFALALALETLESEGIETEAVALADRQIAPCDGCFACRRERAFASMT